MSRPLHQSDSIHIIEAKGSLTVYHHNIVSNTNNLQTCKQQPFKGFTSKTYKGTDTQVIIIPPGNLCHAPRKDTCDQGQQGRHPRDDHGTDDIRLEAHDGL